MRNNIPLLTTPMQAFFGGLAFAGRFARGLIAGALGSCVAKIVLRTTPTTTRGGAQL